MTGLERTVKALWAEELTTLNFLDMTIDETEAFRKRHHLSIEDLDEAHDAVLARWIADFDPADRA